MSALNHQEEISIERIERTLKVAAYVVVRYGKAYAPHVERLEGEFKRARGNDPIAKARAILVIQTDDGARNAMEVSIRALCSSEGPVP
ncbi:MAG: hypothetical protein AB7G08_21540 [Hyphomicrobiaceae bacterium]